MTAKKSAKKSAPFPVKKAVKKPTKKAAVKKVAAVVPALEIPPVKEITAEAIDLVIQEMIKGEREVRLLDFCRAMFPDVDSGELIEKALDKLVEDADIEVDVIRGWTFNAMQLCYRQLIAEGDYVGALRAAKEIHATFGVG